MTGPRIRRRRITDSWWSAVAALVPFTWAATAAAQTPLVHDSASADSIRFDQAPLPGGVASVFRFLFSGVPQWIQIAGVVIGVLGGIVLAVVAWKRRREWLAWLDARSRGTKVAMGASVVLALAVAGSVGAWSWNYMQHENDFCSSCHVMKSAFGRFQKSEHDKLECHDCHQQSIFASAKELYYWVLERPEKIPEHAPVPDAVCDECHAQAQADSSWKRVIATAGHAVHLKSDSASLKGIMCVDCHGKEVHAFKAVDLSCTTSECHTETKIRLGQMATQSGLHCVTCHEFGRTVSELISVDSSSRSMVPARQECFSCHEMREKTESFGLDEDPHKATCGTCHNPHEQDESVTAYKSCATAGCHANADTLTAFHRGLGTHRLDDCGSCHKPHAWKAVSTRCIDCHADINRDRPLRRRQASTDAPASGASAAASAPFLSAPHSKERRVGGPRVDDDAEPAPEIVPPPVTRPAPSSGMAVAPPDTNFKHSVHRKVSCESCHDSRTQHGAVKVKTQKDCQACHHASDARAGKCATCHAPGELSESYAVPTTLKISGRETPLQRSLPYDHKRHERLECSSCHGPGTDAPLVKTCADCHTDHHLPAATCESCHADSRTAHKREDHISCVSCHTAAFVKAMPPSRTLCLSCHPAQKEHKPAGDCVTCHATGWGMTPP